MGYLPLSIAVAYLGSHAESLSLSNALVWVSIAVILLLFVAGRAIGLDRGTFAATGSGGPDA